MKTNLLLITAFLFFLAWRTGADDFLLFCTLFAAGLWVCATIYGLETSHSTLEDDGE